MDKENSDNFKKSNSTIRCPRCRKMINQKDRNCCYCGFDGIYSYISLANRKGIQKKQEENGHGNTYVSWKEIFILLAIAIASFGLLGSCMGNDDRSKEETCQVCYKTFTNADDVHSIIMTNMCENCYSNFKYTQDLKEEFKKYQERYGD